MTALVLVVAVLAAMGALVAVRARARMVRAYTARAKLVEFGVAHPENYLTPKEIDALGKLLARGVVWVNSRGELMFSPWESNDDLPLTLGGGKIVIDRGTIHTMMGHVKGVDLS